MADYVDLLITGDDFTLDAAGVPQMVDGCESIAQDLVHMIREKGLLVELVAERDERRRAQYLLQITIEVDNDERIVPGSTSIEESDTGVFYLYATTVDYGGISVSLEA